MASSDSRSVNARLVSTASAASATLRPRASASVRTYAAASDAAFCDVVSSIFSPEPETGCAAPACVAGAIAATSAAIRRMNPADAARAPDGPTNTTTGARDVIIRDTILRVESSRPPGVRNTSTTSSAPDVSAASIASMKYSAVIGWMMPSISVTMTWRAGDVGCAHADWTMQQSETAAATSGRRGMAARLYVERTGRGARFTESG